MLLGFVRTAIRTCQLTKGLAEVGGVFAYLPSLPMSSISDVYLSIDGNHKHDIMIGTIQGEGGSYFPDYVVFAPASNIEQFPEYTAKVEQCTRVSENLNDVWRSGDTKKSHTKGP